MQYKRATPYNSSISQAFMVMSFAAAGLLMSVQVLGDRPSEHSRQASALDSPSTYEAHPRPPQTIRPRGNHHRDQPTQHHAESSVSQEGVKRPAEYLRPEHSRSEPSRSERSRFEHSRSKHAWSWLTRPFLSPIFPTGSINNRLANSSSQQTPPRNSKTTDKTKEEMQATPAIPSLPNSVSHVISQSRIDSTPSIFNHQEISHVETGNIQTGNIQTDQTEHTLAEQWEDDDQALRPSLAPSLAITEPQSSSPPSTQQSTHVKHTTENSTHQSVATNHQTDQNNIQQEHTTARLVVDLSDRQLAFYQQNEAVQTYPIAVGKAGWETPLGEFTVTDKDPSPLWQHPLTGELVPAGANSPLGSRWIGFWSDGIHQIGFHGTNQPQSIGQAISHGCIRLHDADIQSLYPHIAMGTPVIVQP